MCAAPNRIQDKGLIGHIGPIAWVISVLYKGNYTGNKIIRQRRTVRPLAGGNKPKLYRLALNKDFKI
jgi:hypothetical protein